MKNILYTIILSFLFSSSVFAEWKEVAELEKVKVYLDPDTLERNNGWVYIWSLTDFKKIEHESGASSAATLIAFDCNNIPKKYSIISLKTYSGNMGKGELLLSESNEWGFDWQYPAPNNLYSAIMKAACEL